HSATKYIGGHSNTINGCVMLNNEEVYKQLRFQQNAIGAVPSPFDCYTILVQAKTLPIRMRHHQANAIRIAEWLESHPRVSRVFYPGLASHPQAELALSQMSGFGGVLSFELKATVEETKKAIESLKIIRLAESLGGVESLIEHPASMTHASIPAEERRKTGLSDGLVRLSVGLEHVDDLIEDLGKALSSA
ncbi:PLP-dependent transferase, partial [archaeon]|nr:PLP-dependent transferase [archaeon]